MEKLSKNKICSIFGCTIEQLNKQYLDNAKILGEMKDSAVKTGKKVNGYTASDLDVHEKKYKELSK